MTSRQPTMKTAGLLESLVQTAPPEQRLLFLCSQVRLGEEGEATFANCAGQVRDWEAVIEASVAHSVLPQLAAAVQQVDENAVPSDVREKLKSRSYQNTARNSFLARKLTETVNLLKDDGTPVMPYKGPLLAQALYGDIGMRRFDDLDFLAHESDLFRVRHLMVEHGAVEQPPLTNLQARYYVKAGWSLIYKHPEEDYSVEFDSGLAPRHFAFQIPERVLWQDTIEVPFEGGKVQTLSWENLLIYLCVHGSKHAWSRLLWILDLARLIEQEQLNWDVVFARARTFGVLRTVSLGLLLARDVGKVQLPEDVEYAMNRDPIVPRLAQQAISPIAGGDHPLTGAETVLFHLLARERLRDRLKYILRFIFSPTYSDWRAFAFPPPLYFLYYLLRPFRVLWEKVRTNSRRGAGARSNAADASEGSEP